MGKFKFTDALLGFVILSIVSYIVYGKMIDSKSERFEKGDDSICAKILDATDGITCQENVVEKTAVVKNMVGFPSAITYLAKETTCEVVVNGVKQTINQEDYPEVKLTSLHHKKHCIDFN